MTEECPNDELQRHADRGMSEGRLAETFLKNGFFLYTQSAKKSCDFFYLFLSLCGGQTPRASVDRARMARHSAKALVVLARWLQDNLDCPYPDETDKARLASKSGDDVVCFTAFYSRSAILVS